MYRVDGDPNLPEETLEHFEGYRGSYPVRAGNGAADQLQLDIYGEAVYALSQGREIVQQSTYAGWKALTRTLDWLAGARDRPDEGIWETRGGRKDFTYSRVMSWVAFDHGLRLADVFRRPADTVGWTKAGTPSSTRSWNAAGANRRRPSSSSTAAVYWTPRCC